MIGTQDIFMQELAVTGYVAKVVGTVPFTSRELVSYLVILAASSLDAGLWYPLHRPGHGAHHQLSPLGWKQERVALRFRRLQASQPGAVEAVSVDTA